MNTSPSNLNQPVGDDQFIDLLVDGELSEDQYSELLLKLDQEPNGWRRCALAFVEAQQWRRQFGAMVHEPRRASTPVSPSVPLRPAHKPWWNRPAAGTLLAVAASFLVAFGLGRGTYRLGDPVGPAAPANHVIVRAATPDANPWEAVTLVVDNGPDRAASQVQVPVIEGAMPDENWLSAQPAGLPPDVRHMLERLGHQVKQQRQLVPIQLDDGRRGIVPMDRVEILPVGARSFQ